MSGSIMSHKFIDRWAVAVVAGITLTIFAAVLAAGLAVYW